MSSFIAWESLKTASPMGGIGREQNGSRDARQAGADPLYRRPGLAAPDIDPADAAAQLGVEEFAQFRSASVC
jgi:hypothetical protein